MNWITSTTLPLWQVIGGAYLLLVIGWHMNRIYMIHIMPDDKAARLVARKNAPKAWANLFMWLVVVPGLVSVFLIIVEIITALTKALEDFVMGEIPLPFMILAGIGLFGTIIYLVIKKRK